jgi:hypothetical protein
MFKIIVNEFNNFEKYDIKLLKGNSEVESENNLDYWQAEDHLNQLINGYKLGDNTTIINNIFDGEGKPKYKDRLTVGEYLEET